ncbi:hypothetical protein [Terriglobus roseus]|uniref:hypothetical protein n=1 Tax=Terriglobus roseus TaxID=392734 RepID=UPI0002F52CFE|nr:hypothetical protein [Terriglobus roseus]
MFTALRLHRTVWAGSLVLGLGLNDAGRAFALASLAAGAAALLLEDDPARLREASREGCATFTVTTLDEALRALKNEVRQGRAITVALGGSVEQWLSEMAERGVLPRSLAVARELSDAEAAAIGILKDWGAERLHGLGLIGPGEVELTVGAHWAITTDTATNQAERRSLDAALLAAAEGDAAMSEVTRQWLRAAPTLFPRSLDRSHWQSLSTPVKA